MTQNQIRYLEALETARSNQAKEQEMMRANLAKEAETNRANLENERRAREQLEYDKYGKGGGGLGGTIRTIKAGLSDIGELVTKVKDSGGSLTGTDLYARGTGTEPTPTSPRVIDIQGDIAVDQAREAKKVENVVKKEADEQYTKQLTSPTEAPRNVQSAQNLVAKAENSNELSRLENLLEKKEEQRVSPTKAPRTAEGAKQLNAEISELKKQINKIISKQGGQTSGSTATTSKGLAGNKIYAKD